MVWLKELADLFPGMVLIAAAILGVLALFGIEAHAHGDHYHGIAYNRTVQADGDGEASVVLDARLAIGDSMDVEASCPSGEVLLDSPQYRRLTEPMLILVRDAPHGTMNCWLRVRIHHNGNGGAPATSWLPFDVKRA